MVLASYERPDTVQTTSDAHSLSLIADPLLQAIEDDQIVVAQGLWQRIDEFVLLPFLLHSTWADCIAAFPLNASFTLVPFSSSDAVLLEEPILAPSEVHSARYQARAHRNNENRFRATDFYWPDWEAGYISAKQEITERCLPPCSYITVTSVRPDGRQKSWPRPVLGRYAKRNSIRPRLMVPGRGNDSWTPEALRTLTSSDLLLVNLQQVRGERMARFIQRVLAARGPSRPCLIVASSPADLLFLDDRTIASHARVVPFGDEPTVPMVDVHTVGRERPQLEREFDLTLRELRGESQDHDRLVQLGMSAWWAANQGLTPDPSADPTIRRFFTTLDRLASRDFARLSDFNAFRGVLLRTLLDSERIEERSAALEACVLEHLNRSHRAVSVVVREVASARILAQRIADSLGCSVEELPDWKVHVRTSRGPVPTERPETLILLGFSGFSSIDVILSSRAERAVLVLDPVEASLAVMSAKRTGQWLRRAGLREDPVAAVANATQPIALRGESVSLACGFDVFRPINPLAQFAGSSRKMSERQRLLISFLDGESLVVDSTRRFDRIEPTLATSKTVPAAALCPGDEVILTDQSSSFSERLIGGLDSEKFKAQADRRKTWLTLVETLVQAAKLSKREVHRQLQLSGVQVDYQTVRAWTGPTEDDDRVPARWEHFAALAKVLGIGLPESELRDLFGSIRTLRVWHRKAGRDLVRMMRAARAGRLDPVALKRIETSFGMTVRELIERTRVAVIDDIQPEV